MVTPSTEIIIVLVKDNPKRPGSASFDRFALYKQGMTVDEYLKAGGQRSDLRWDSDRNFIKITDGAAPQADEMGATQAQADEPPLWPWEEIQGVLLHCRDQAEDLVKSIHDEAEESRANLEEHFPNSPQADILTDITDSCDSFLNELDNVNGLLWELPEHKNIEPDIAITQFPIAKQGRRKGYPKKISVSEYRGITFQQAQDYLEFGHEALQRLKNSGTLVGEKQVDTINELIAEWENLNAAEIEH